MTKYTLGEQHIYNSLMSNITAHWKTLILYKKGYKEYKQLYGEERIEIMLALAYNAIETLYSVLEVGFYINTEKMHKALTNYRYFGRCHE